MQGILKIWEVTDCMENLGRKPFIGLLLALLVGTCLGYARKSSSRSTNVTFTTQAKFKNGTTLPAGTYKMEVPEGSETPVVLFSKDGRVMATTKAKLINEEKKNPYTEVRSTIQGHSQMVNEIDPSGWNEVLRFTPSS